MEFVSHARELFFGHSHGYRTAQESQRGLIRFRQADNALCKPCGVARLPAVSLLDASQKRGPPFIVIGDALLSQAPRAGGQEVSAERTRLDDSHVNSKRFVFCCERLREALDRKLCRAI